MIDETIYREASELKFRYALAVDQRDWNAYRVALTDEIEVDFRSIGYRDVMQIPAEQWIRQVRKLMDGLDASHHQISACVVEQIPTDTRVLSLRSYVTAQHVIRVAGAADRCFQIGGRYDDLAVRVNGRLRLSRLTFNQSWAWGDEAVMTEAVHRSKEQAKTPIVN